MVNFFKKYKALFISLLISLGVGGLSTLLTNNNMDTYKTLIKPPLSPPGILFPFIWTALFILMGISAYLIYKSDSPDKGKALTIYGEQLLVNFFWTIIFFNMKTYLFAFIWLLVLIFWVILMIYNFYKINKKAAYLQIPYLLWIIFAAYLNLMIFILNK